MQIILTNVLIDTISKKEASDSFGVLISNLPDPDYSMLAKGIKPSRQIEFYFLGFQILMLTEDSSFYSWGLLFLYC